MCGDEPSAAPGQTVTLTFTLPPGATGYSVHRRVGSAGLSEADRHELMLRRLPWYRRWLLRRRLARTPVFQAGAIVVQSATDPGAAAQAVAEQVADRMARQ